MSSDTDTFHAHLSSSKRILVIIGAGVSAASGLGTLRGPTGDNLWRGRPITGLCTRGVFSSNPDRVWQYYSWFRHTALQAVPNAAHYALAALSKAHPSALTLNQNIDGLSARSGHPSDKIENLHGSAFRIRCVRDPRLCDYVEEYNDVDPIVPYGENDRLTSRVLPRCPKCEEKDEDSFVRPGVTWYGEDLDREMMRRVDEYIDKGVDLCLVVGTSGTVYPASGIASRVSESGGKVAIVDLDVQSRKDEVDWVFEGDACILLPMLLEPIIGANFVDSVCVN